MRPARYFSKDREKTLPFRKSKEAGKKIIWLRTRSPAFHRLITLIQIRARARRPTFHHPGVCDLTVAERSLWCGTPSLGEMELWLSGQIVPRRWCPGSKLEVQSQPCEACKSSRPCPCIKNGHHAGNLAVSVHLPPLLLAAHLLLLLSERIGSSSCKVGLRHDGSHGQSSPLGPLKHDGLFLSYTWPGSWPVLGSPTATGPHWTLPTRVSFHLGLHPFFSLGPLAGSSDPDTLSHTSFASGSFLFWAVDHWFWRGTQCGLREVMNGSGFAVGTGMRSSGPLPLETSKAGPSWTRVLARDW